jgi:Tfp pilus assembly protein PilF
VGLGVAHALDGQFERAEKAFASALAIDPWCPEAWLNLARTQFDTGCVAEARHSLRRALRCNPCLQLPECLLAELR